jgi:hypothetical protein
MVAAKTTISLYQSPSAISLMGRFEETGSRQAEPLSSHSAREDSGGLAIQQALRRCYFD